MISEGDKNTQNSKLNDAVNSYGDTILHFAVFHEKIELIKFLLSHGADPLIKNKV